MRVSKQWLTSAFIMFALVLAGNHHACAQTSGQDEQSYIENIAFEKMTGKERILITVTKQPMLKVESPTATSVVMTLDNILLKSELNKTMGEGQLKNVVKVTPYQKTIDGKTSVFIKTDLRQRVPYSVKQEGKTVVIDFNLNGVAHNNNAGTMAVDTPGAATASTITVDFQEASIRSVLRLLAETGGVNIVAGDDVKGNVTVSMKRVPWTQALETILRINGLAKKQDGNVITVMTSERLKKDEAARKAAEDEYKKIELSALIEQGKLRQINIEAKIVEASEDFVRQIGVQWGAGVIGSSGSHEYGAMGSTVTGVGILKQLPNGIGLTSSNLATNFPAAAGTPSIGIVIGGAKAILDAKLSALESSNEGQIISSPKVTTMDNVKATIKQGEEIPYTTYDNNGNAIVSFKEALLKLEVTPKITAEDKISMTIKASNDRGNYARVTELKGNVPIIKNEVDSTVVVRNGDTLVIGGVLRNEDAKGMAGVPWLSKIPVLGWLFKSESVTKSKRHLLIFVTPRIIEENTQVDKIAKN